MKKILMLAIIALGLTAMVFANGQSGDDGTIKIGVVQITLEHEYQIILNQGYKDKAAELGVEVIFAVNEMNPEKTVAAAENLIAAGVDALIVAPADTASWKACVNLAREAGIPLVNDGSPQEITPYAAPFTGTDNFYGGTKAGEFAAEWINENIPASEKVVVAHLTLPTFTDCVKRNDGFVEALDANIGREYEIYEEAGWGSREGGLEAMENLLQAHPDINIVFGCNDDSALGALSAMKASGKTVEDNLVIGFDGSLKGLQELQKDSMYRLNIAQLPYLYSGKMMEKAVMMANGETTSQALADKGAELIEPVVVDASNAQDIYDEFVGYMPK